MTRRIRDRIAGLEVCDQFVFRKRVLCVSDEAVIRRRHREVFGCAPDLEEPETFCEKILWLMLNDRRPERSPLADKYEVRAFVRDRVGSEYLIEMLGIYEDVAEINWDALPDAFVLKATHGSKWNIICPDKAGLDRAKAIRDMRRWLKHNFYWYGREWVYRDLKHRIIAERFLDDGSGHPPSDYKFFCFDGVPKLIQVDASRFENHRRNFYTPDWELLPVTMTYPRNEQVILPPTALQDMLRVAQQLSAGIPFVRVDLYECEDRVWFGELTFSPGRGLESFDDPAFHREVGGWLRLPEPVPDRGFWSRLSAVLK